MHETAARPDFRFLFGYEEAIGYAVNDVVRDKDGISAASGVAGSPQKQTSGTDVAGRLDDIARRVGSTPPTSFPRAAGEAGAERISRIMTALRSFAPAELLAIP